MWFAPPVPRARTYVGDVVLTWILVAAALLMVSAAFVYAWRNRPFRGPGADTTAVDEMAMQASKFTTRGPCMGADIGTDL